MTYDFLNLSTSNHPYTKELKEAACRVIDSGRYLNGTEVESLEKEIASYVNEGASSVKAVAVSTGLDAIRLIFRAYMEEGRLKAGDEVIFPANTFIASVLPLTELGLKAVPAPADPLTHNLDFQRLDEFITPATKAVLLVHLYGSPCWDPEACGKLNEKGILVVEDCAQALGARSEFPGFNGSTYCGALGNAAAISFYPTKNLGALGDAGMVLTSDPLLAKDVRILAQYGSDRRYHNIYRGYNNRMDELQAAFLRVKLPYLDDENNRRREVAAAYSESITHPDVTPPLINENERQVWHQFVIRCKDRDGLKGYLAEKGIATDIHYPVPPHAQLCYEGEFSGATLHEARELADSVLSLPIANITPDDARHIAGIINSYKS